MIKTTYPSVVIYTANYLPKCRNNFKKLFAPHQAICFECMFPPNSINSPFIENKQDILKKGETYNQKIIYSFSTFD
jgi:aldose 1-epimerase